MLEDLPQLDLNVMLLCYWKVNHEKGSTLCDHNKRVATDVLIGANISNLTSIIIDELRSEAKAWFKQTKHTIPSLGNENDNKEAMRPAEAVESCMIIKSESPEIDHSDNLVLEFSEDSPMFRVRLDTVYRNSMILKRHIKSVQQQSKKFTAGGIKLGRTCQKFRHALTDQQCDIAETDRSAIKAKDWFNSVGQLLPAFEQFGSQISCFDTSLMNLFEKQENAFSNSLVEIMENQFLNVARSKKKFQKHSNDYEAALERHLHGSKRLPNTPRVRPRISLEEQRYIFQLARFDCVQSLNQVDILNRQEIRERILHCLDAYITFFRDGKSIVDPMEKLRHQLQLQLHEERTEFEKLQEQWNLQRQDLLEQLDSQREPFVEDHTVGSRENKGGGIGIAKQGYLFMCDCSRVSKTWTRLWFILDSGKMMYIPTSDSTEINTTILCDIKLCTVRDVADILYGFEICSADERQFTLQAESLRDLHSWREALQLNIENLLGGGDGSTRLRSPLNENKTLVKSVEDIRKQNALCADCGASDPDWCSLNLGVVICIECSGIHRSFGVHVSKVRSISLDEMDFTTLAVIQQLGNKVANCIYESKLDDNWPKPTACSSRCLKEQWIRAKYQCRAFVNNAYCRPSEELYSAVQRSDLHAMYHCVALGADVNYICPTDSQRTALHCASSRGDTLSVEFLLLCDASIDILDGQHCTAVDLAMLFNHLPILDLFHSRVNRKCS